MAAPCESRLDIRFALLYVEKPHGTNNEPHTTSVNGHELSTGYKGKATTNLS